MNAAPREPELVDRIEKLARDIEILESVNLNTPTMGKLLDTLRTELREMQLRDRFPPLTPSSPAAVTAPQ